MGWLTEMANDVARMCVTYPRDEVSCSKVALAQTKDDAKVAAIERFKPQTMKASYVAKRINPTFRRVVSISVSSFLTDRALFCMAGP